MTRRLALQLTVVAAVFVPLVHAAPAQAQAARTFVSGLGDDGNPCSRASPCKTFAGALSKTVAGGEIDALDPGDFGTVVIEQAVTIDGGAGQVASILVPPNGFGIQVAVQPTETVVLRNLRINGLAGNRSALANAGFHAITFSQGAALSVENCTIVGFQQTGILAQANSAAASTLNVFNTSITNVHDGIVISRPVGGGTFGQADHVTIQKAVGFGIAASSSAVFTVTNSNILNAATAGISIANGPVLNIDSSSVSSNNTAFSVDNAFVRISRNTIYDNNLNYNAVAGGVVATSGDNIVAINGATVPNGTVAKQ